MKLHQTKIETIFPLYTDWVENFSEIEEIKFPSESTILFLAADFSKIPEKDLKKISLRLINSGVSYLCLFGNDCDRVIDFFEDSASFTSPVNGFTCVHHKDETIEEALGFCILNAVPKEEVWPVSSLVLLSVGTLLGELTLPIIANDIEYLNRNISEY